MSLNTAHANGGCLIYAGEVILIFYDKIELSFDQKKVPHFNGNKKGRIFLTTHRIIFNSTNSNDMLQSFSIPFRNMREVELEQPVFGANYIKGKIIAESGGNWEGEANFKMWFKSGGAIEFGQAMLTAAKMASRNQPPQPPPYCAPCGPFYAPPPPVYMPPPQYQSDWVPYNTFPTAPPPDSVYTTSAPPPYPGISQGPPQQYPPQAYSQQYPHQAYPPQQNPLADAKAREAGMSAYYNNNNPNTVYMPPSAPPPPYSSLKKTE